MTTSRHLSSSWAGWIVVALVGAIALFGSCADDNPVDGGNGNGGNGPPPTPGEATVTIRLSSWDDLSGSGPVGELPAGLDEIRFEIFAPDIPTQRRSIAISQDLIEEDFTIQQGVARRIDVMAYNAADSLLYRGMKYTDIADSVLVSAVVMVSSADDTPPVHAGLDDAVAVSDTYVRLSWQIATDGADPDHEAQYLIYMATHTDSMDYSHPSYIGAPGQTSFLIANLQPATTYYFVARAMDRAGNIAVNTSQQSATTSAATGGSTSTSRPATTTRAAAPPALHARPSPTRSPSRRATRRSTWPRARTTPRAERCSLSSSNRASRWWARASGGWGSR